MNIKDLKRKILKNYIPYTYGEQPDPKEKWIKLNTNENPFSPPTSVLNEIKDAVNEKLRLYPDPLCNELRKLLSEVYFKDYNGEIQPNNIVVANGSDEILDILFKAFVDIGDKVIMFNPSYGMYPALAALYGGESIKIDLGENFEIPIESAKVEGKLMFLCSPNNPNGKATPISVIEEIASNFSGIIIVDEAYSNFSSTTAIPLIKRYKNIAVMRTFSKGYCFASERIGFLVADPELIQILIDVKLPYNVTHLSQVAAIAAIHNIEEYEALNKTVIEEREKLRTKINQLGYNALESDSNYVLIDLQTPEIAKTVFETLKENKILVRTYSNEVLLKYIRVSLGKPKDNEEFLRVFQQALNTN